MNEELPSRLMEHCIAGQPWPADQLGRALGRARPGELLRLFRSLGVRSEVIQPEGMPLLETLINRSRPGRRRPPDQSSVNLPRLLYLLRAQWDHFVSEFHGEVLDRLHHVWQVQLCPVALRKRMLKLGGVTFLPGRRKEEFPDGEEFIELKHLTALSLGFRQHQSRRDQYPLDMLDVKVHGFRVDPAGGQASLVPVYARQFNYAPFPGADRRIVESANHSAVRGGLDLHRAMEWTAVTGGGIREEPEFPRLYLGFPENGACDLEVTTDLKVAAWRLLDAYVRAGRPEAWDQCPDLVAVRGGLEGRPRPTWADYERKLGPDDARHVLLATVAASTVEHDGLFLVPLDFFQAFSQQRPVQKAVRMYARMEPGLLRRDRLVGVARFDDRGAFTGVDGVVKQNPRLARVQVVRVPDRSCWAGTSGVIEWDFRTVPEWSRSYFPEPGGPVPEEAPVGDPSCPDSDVAVE